MSGEVIVREPVDASPGPPDPPPSDMPLGRLVLGGLLILFGAVWLLDAAGVADLRWSLLLPAALTLVGVTLLATATRGAHGGLVATGIVLTVLVLMSNAVPVTTPLAGAGDRSHRPTSLAEAQAGYELGMGKLTVDLRDVDIPREGGEVTASVGMGELVVRLPAGVGAQVRATSGAGEVVILATSRGGVGVSLTEEIPGNPTLVLDLSVGMGKVEVRR